MLTSVSRSKIRLAGLVAGALLLVPAWAADGAAEPGADASAAAVWTPKELLFVYQGFTTRYSCDGLRDKVTRALIELGARKKGLQVRESGCAAPYGRPDPFPGVRIKMEVLAPAAGSGGDDKHPPVQAHWQPVNLDISDYGNRNDSGECELVEQIHNKILPLFTTRNVDLHSVCVPHQASAGGASLKLEALAVEQKDDKTRPGY
jgi:hypothetical protein